MKRFLERFTGGREQDTGAVSSPELRAWARPPVVPSARALEAAIAAASFMRRSPTEDGERIMVSCHALGGHFIYSLEEAERRIGRYSAGLAPSDERMLARFLEDRVLEFLKPVQTEDRLKTSWVFGWREGW